MKTQPCIAVVDDDASVGKALCRLLRCAGYNSKSFCSAEELLQHIFFEAPDCLVLDVQMPGVSGLVLQEHLAAKGLVVPIVFITAHDDDHNRKRALRAGAVDFLLKPVMDQVLISAIQRALNSKPQPAEPVITGEMAASACL